MLRLRDGFLLFFASLGRFVLSVQGILFRFTNVFRVYRAAPCLHRGPASLLHHRHLTTNWPDWGGVLQHRRWATRRRLRTAGAMLVLVLGLGLQSRRSDDPQGDRERCRRQSPCVQFTKVHTSSYGTSFPYNVRRPVPQKERSFYSRK